MSVEKKIIVTAALDPSFDKVKASIQQLVSEVSKLGEAFNRINQGFGGGGGGGFKLDSKTGIAASPGGGGSSMGAAVHRAASTVGSGGGGVANNLARSVQNMSQLFKIAGEQGSGAMRLMSDTLRRNVDESDRQIDRLTRSLSKLTGSYDQLSKMKTLGLGDPDRVERTIKGVQARYAEKAQALAEAQSQRAELRGHDNAGVSPLDGGPDLPPEPKPWYRRMFGGGGAAGGKGGGGISDYLFSRLGLSSGFGLPVGAALAGWGGFTYGAGAAQSHYTANMAQAIEKPLWYGQRQAAFGGFYGGNAQAISGGDFSRAYALSKMAKDSNYTSMLNDQYKEILKKSTTFATPTDLLGNIAKGNTMGYIKSQIGSVANAIPGTADQSIPELERAKAAYHLASKLPELQSQYLSNQMQADPVKMALMNQVGQGAIGDLSMARAAGMSGGLNRRKDGTYVDSIDAFRSRFLNAGYDPGEGVGMIQQVSGEAGRGLMHKRTLGLLSMQHGGLQNAVSLYALGTQYRGGGRDKAGWGFMGGLQSQMGRGALDVTAGSQLFNTAAGYITNPNFNSSNPEDFAKSLAEATYTGTPGEDMRMSRVMGGGLSSYQNMLSGGTDPLQMALNASSAIGAAPDAGYYTHQGLMQMDPATMLSALRSGEAPEWFKMRGGNIDMIKSYASSMASSGLSRLVTQESAGTEMGGAAQRYLDSGGLGYLKGMKQGDRDAEMDKLAEAFGASMGLDRQSARGLVRTLAAAEGGVFGELKGGGAHQSASMKTIHGAGARGQGALATQRGERVAELSGADNGTNDFNENVGKDFERAAAVGANQDSTRRAAQEALSETSPDEALDDVQAALQKFVAALRNIDRPKRNRAPAMAKAPGAHK